MDVEVSSVEEIESRRIAIPNVTVTIVGAFRSRSRELGRYIVFETSTGDIVCSCPGFWIAGRCWHADHEGERLSREKRPPGMVGGMSEIDLERKLLAGIGITSLPALAAGSALAGRVNPEPQAANGLTTFKLISAATTNATSVKAAAGQLYTILASNVNAAARFLKFYNKATAPAVGTDVPVLTFLIPAGGALSLDTGGMGFAFPLGIALAITALVADADVTAVALNEIVVNLGIK